MGNLLESCEHREPAPLAIGMLATERNLRNRLHRRLIKLHGTCNFRDVGGHKTGRGRSVRWGEVYRADRLSTLAWEAQADLTQLEIKTIVDLRTSAEVAARPDRNIPWNVTCRSIEVDLGGVPEAVHAEVEAAVVAAQKTGVVEALPTDFMKPAYVHFAAQCAPAWRELLDIIGEAENRPVVFHCDTGKDRAGFAAALLLLILDIPGHTVTQDFLFSNDCRRHNKRELFSRGASLLSPGLSNADTTALAIYEEEVQTVHASHLAAATEAMAASHGTVEAYIEGALGFSAERRKALQDELLETNVRDTLLADQDAEFQQALAADQALHRARQAQEEEARRVLQLQEAAQASQREHHDQREAAERQRQRDVKRANIIHRDAAQQLPSEGEREAAARAALRNSPAAQKEIKVRATLPTGGLLGPRLFKMGDEVEALYAWVGSALEQSDDVLITAFPKRDLLIRTQTLLDVGLQHNEVLTVTICEVDSDSDSSNPTPIMAPQPAPSTVKEVSLND